MAKNFRVVSMCLTDILDADKSGHSAFTCSDKNKKVYFNVVVNDYDELNKFGQNVSIRLNPPKDFQDEKIYIGNGKIIQSRGETTNSPQSPIVPENLGDDLPF